MTSEDTPHIPYNLPRQSSEEMRERLDAMYAHLSNRRSVRTFSSEPIPLELLERAIQIAGTAPSGAHKQPWSFCIVTDPESEGAHSAGGGRGRAAQLHRAHVRPVARRTCAPLATDHVKPFH